MNYFDPPEPNYSPDEGDSMPAPDMTDAETAATIREWCASTRSHWSWPTDVCGYTQHIRFVRHRNEHFKPGDDFKTFALAYADSLEGRAK